MSQSTRSTGSSQSQPLTRSSLAPSTKARQLSHLNAQLAQLTANMSDLENLLRMTSVQAQAMRGLGGYTAAMFMSASKVLGEDVVNGDGAAVETSENHAG